MTDISWSAAPVALQGALVPILAMLVVALVILFAVAWVRVVTGRSIDQEKDD